MFTEKTRLKFALILTGAIFIEGIVKALMPGFPFAEAIGAQVGILLGYTYAKTKDNLTTIRVGAGGSGA